MPSVAPSCPTSTSEFPATQTGVRLPSVPQAQDLPSAIQAINNLNMIVQVLSGQNPPSFKNNLTENFFVDPSGGQGIQRGNQGGRPGSPAKKPRWVEDRASRVTETVKVTNPDDKSQFVMVERINYIRWSDTVTGQTLEWRR